ncbi:MAG: cardiolipin synthase [Clostridia bacterium]|nr:cardiolipin synthase [Clostridia bacterium]
MPARINESEKFRYHPLEVKRRRGGKFRGSDIIKIRTEHNNITAVKGALALLFVLVQLGIILAITIYAELVLTWYLVLCLVLSIVTAVYCLSSERNAGSKAIWVLVIIIFFVIGFIIYWLSDDRVMYVRQRRRHRAIYEDTKKYLGEHEFPEVSGSVAEDCRYLYNSAGFVPYKNSGLKYYYSGGTLFDGMIESMKSAKKFIFMEFFIIADGSLFDRIWRVLTRKMEEGVEVYIIYDDMGASKELKLKTARMMRKSSACVKAFNRLMSRFSFAMNYRDHRKIVVIDGKEAYTGGCNLSDEYINSKRMYGYWKDSGVKVTGEAVDAFTLMFMRQWSFIVKSPMDYEKYLRLFDRVESGFAVVPYAGGPDVENTVCKGIYNNIISAAHKFVYIFTPYFVPDESILDALKDKALSGVDVRVVIPDIPDKSYVFMLTLDRLERLLKSGVKVFRLTSSFVHSKAVLSENSAVVGSANFDMRSFYQQFENGVYTNDPAFMNELKSDFESCMRESIEVTKKAPHNLIYRMCRGILKIVEPLM